MAEQFDEYTPGETIIGSALAGLVVEIVIDFSLDGPGSRAFDRERAENRARSYEHLAQQLSEPAAREVEQVATIVRESKPAEFFPYDQVATTAGSLILGGLIGAAISSRLRRRQYQNQKLGVLRPIRK